MGQATRSQGISFTHEMWQRIDERCQELNCGRSKYFQMLVDWDFHTKGEIHPHRSDGLWHFYPEAPALKVAEPDAPAYGAKPAKKSARR